MLMQNPETKTRYLSIDSESPLLDCTLPTATGDVSVGELGERFYSSHYATAMAEQPFRFAQEPLGYDRGEMRQELGPDVCPIGHQVDSLRFLEQVIDAEQAEQTLFSLDDKDRATLAFVCLIHDIGESMHDEVEQEFGTVLGDKASGTKTDADRKLESDIRFFFYDKLFSDVDPEIIERAEAIIGHQDETHLHDIYEASHTLQTLDTTQHAKQAVLTPTGSEKKRNTLLYISEGVRTKELGKLAAKYLHFTAVRSIVDEHTPKQPTYTHFVTPENAAYHTRCCLPPDPLPAA